MIEIKNLQKKYLSLNNEVKQAISKKQPIVALESTIITHGMPYPQNLQMALNVEQIVRKNGAIPATIAIMDGKLRVGLDRAELTNLAKNANKAFKASRKDVAYILSKRQMAGTTVATTMQIAALAAIRFFATGGIGGVHRGAEKNFDISADLEELAKTAVAVICAGAKSILDIGKTLEVLETKGVPIIGFNSEEFPAFYLRKSGYKLEHNLSDVREIALMLNIQWSLDMAGVVIANPIPKEKEMKGEDINSFINIALKEAKENNIGGKNITPFLLKRIFELSNGQSLEANIALVENNAALAAKIARAYQNMDKL